MNIIGMDLSVRASGVCFRDNAAVTIVPKTKGDDRFGEIADRILTYCQTARAHLAVIEEAPPGLKGHADAVYGVQAVVRTELIRAGIPYAEIRPNVLKKFATGNGSANKTDMAMAAFKRAKVEFPDSDQCDAWWLRVAGEVHYEDANFETVAQFYVPKEQRAALAGVVWPDVTMDSVIALQRVKREEACRRAERVLYGVDTWTGAA